MERQYIISERAHFMCPNMHFGMLVEIPAVFSLEKVYESFGIMSKAHPFLRSVIKYEEGSTRLFYDIKEHSEIEIYEGRDIEHVWDDYKAIGAKGWNVLESGLLKVFLYPLKEGFKILFVGHHLLGDGRCLLEVVGEFANLYGEGTQPDYVEERLIKNIDDLPPHSKLRGISKLLVKRLNNEWRKEGKKADYKTYAEFASLFQKENPVSYEICSMDANSVLSMKNLCKEQGLSVNDLLMAKGYIAMHTPKIIMAADIRSQLKCYRQGALGNYATAMGVVCKSRTKDVLKKAEEVHKQVRIHRSKMQKLMMVLACYMQMDKDLIDAVAIATLGDFDSKVAKFVGVNMFGYEKRDGRSITNLGSINNPNIKEAIFIPPASPATIQTIGVLTVNNKMQLCSSYYEKAISAEDVKAQFSMLIKNEGEYRA